ncbi:type 1 fimbrae adaptor subunit FimG [Raoultella ornithinolytica]|nr:type 1 fimbrae adaptor subunit FimG [Raoultella ornithinolytica]
MTQRSPPASPLQVRALTVNGGATQGTIQAVISVTYTYA